MSKRNVSLEDKYALETGATFMTGIQALVRLPLDQIRADRRAGLNTGGFISGYRGSPLGGYDQQLKRAQKYLDSHDVVLWEGLNEDLGATAVWGSQQLGVYPGARKQGVFGIWYGKAPGVDRTGDVFKHANFAGVGQHGGVLAIAGDDHNCKSSTLPSQSEFAFMDSEIPVLSPSSIQDVLDFGLYGFALSRFSGLWIGMIALADTMDSGAVIHVDPGRLSIRTPSDFALPASGVHMRASDLPMEKEARLRHFKLPAAEAFVRANGLDAIVLAPKDQPARFGIVVTGQAGRDVFEALAALGLEPEEAAGLGLAILKVAMPWPLSGQTMRAFSEGKEALLVIEHKRALMEPQIRASLYDLPDGKRPRITGKTDRAGRPYLPDTASLSIPEIARALYDLLPKQGAWVERAEAYFKRVGLSGDAALELAASIVRKPHYCSGCPHNTSTVTPEGSRALAGIGCHYMANFMGRADMTSQMGGEGVSWIGQAPFTTEKHIFINLGDGTYAHSGSLAIRAALTGKINVTYKILYNSAVAMTGGQSVETEASVADIAAQLHAEGVKTIVVVTEDVSRYALDGSVPSYVRVYPRSRLEEVQRQLRDTPGVTVLIYDQMCATEKRRKIKRGLMPSADVRAFINPAVCEGCGDCSAKSNCLSVEPLETEFGRKRKINQSTCNQDLRCVDGFCPSFVTVKGGLKAKDKSEAPKADIGNLPHPSLKPLNGVHSVLFTGVGGTGVTTVAAILAMAAHIDGRASSALDMTGLAQKGGAVTSHLRIANKPEDIKSGRIPAASVDALIACDLIVAAGADTLSLLDKERTRIAANMDVAPTAAFITDRSAQFDGEFLKKRLEKAGASLSACSADLLAEHAMGDLIFSNMIMAGFAWQQGLIPISVEAIRQAIGLNGVAVKENQRAFDLGRLAAARPEDARALLPNTAALPADPLDKPSLDALIARRTDHLTKYQNAAYANEYLDLVAKVRAKESALHLGERLTFAVANYYSKLKSYKDEYEVARLYTDGTWKKAIADTFAPGAKVKFHLAPPLIAPKDKLTGHLQKMAFGPWMYWAFKGLSALKGLRGTAFDLVGWTGERKMERGLISAYRARIEQMLERLSAQNHALAVEIASLPDEIRGYGHVKEASVHQAKARETKLWARFEAPARKDAQTPIAAE